MRLVEGLLLHDTPDGTIAVATGDATKVLNGMIRLSPTAAFLFRALSQDTTEDALVQAVMTSFANAEEATVRSDIEKLLSDLRRAHLLLE